MHRFYLDQHLSEPGQTLSITGDEAVHAVRVKRLQVGEPVEVRDGRGGVAAGVVAAVHPAKAQASITVRVETLHRAERARPLLEVCTATPKGGRVDDMIDGLAQVGAASWRPLRTERGVVDPRENKLDRLERVAVESAKQCGRAWLLEIGGRIGFEEAVRGEPGVRVVVADASGEAFPRPADAERVRLLVGPEGGWTEGEVELARRAGATIARFGVHTMRIETAAVVAAGIVMGA